MMSMTWEWFISSALIRSIVGTSTLSCASRLGATTRVHAHRATEDNRRADNRVERNVYGNGMNELLRSY